MENIAISLKGIGKKYISYASSMDMLKSVFTNGRIGSKTEHWALQDIDISIHKGEVVGLIGRNGAGKSTLLQIICKTLQPNAGEIVVNGKIAALLELGSGFNPEFSGKENVYLSAAIAGMSRAEIESKYDDIVAFSEIGDFIKLPVKTYSSGMLVRLAFSVATSVEPEILIIDEALSVGDGAFARKSFDRIMSLKERGCTILFCSHSLFQIESLCERAVWIEKGQIKMQGSPSEIIPEYELSLEGSTHCGLSDDRSALSKTIRIIDVRASSTELISCMDDLVIEVDYAYDGKLEAPALIYEIFTLSGQTVTSGISKNDGFLMSCGNDGKGTAAICFPNIKLMRGKYRVDVYLMCEKCIHLYDHASSCLILDVKQENNEKGVVFLEHSWR